GRTRPAPPGERDNRDRRSFIRRRTRGRARPPYRDGPLPSLHRRSRAKAQPPHPREDSSGTGRI
ncbi:MAG: hypothetical protein AVDCRST_MAG37-430, partial [uncultured Rubrobacteraceae bacterium]